MPAGFTPPPSGNDWGAFAYGSPVPQPNGFVTGPDSSTDGNLAVFDGTTGNRIKDGGAPGGGGSYLVANTARVDPEGDDSTGTVGDLAQPFLTRQAAITALEAQGGFVSGTPAVLLVPIHDNSDNVTTSLEYLTIIGLGAFNLSAPAIGTITFTGTGAIVGLQNIFCNGVLAPNATATLEVHLHSAIVNGAITSNAEAIVSSDYNIGVVSGTIACGDGTNMVIRGLLGPPDLSSVILNAPNSSLEIHNSIISDVTDADSISLFDSVLMANTSGVVPTVTDTLRNGFYSSLILHSTGDSNDPGNHPYTYLNSGIIIKDANDVEIFRLWADDPVATTNLFIGASSGAAVSGGSVNTGVGFQSLQFLTTGSYNTAIGWDGLNVVETGDNNIGIGQDSGPAVVNGDDNVCIGSFSPSSQFDHSRCVAIGNGTLVKEDNCIAIGNEVNASTADNIAVIGNDAVTDVYFGSDAGLAKAHASTFIGNVMALTPQADPPGSPTEGMIYADTDHHLYYYNGTIWKQLDN